MFSSCIVIVFNVLCFGHFRHLCRTHQTTIIDLNHQPRTSASTSQTPTNQPTMESTPASVSCANTCETTTPFKTTYEPLNPTHIILMATSIQSFVRSLGPSALPVPPTNNEQQQQASSTITHKWLPASNNCDNSPVCTTPRGIVPAWPVGLQLHICTPQSVLAEKEGVMGTYLCIDLFLNSLRTGPSFKRVCYRRTVSIWLLQ